MAIGLAVDKQTLDVKAARAVLRLRESLEDVETIAVWLGNHPVDAGNDPLMADPFGYDADEAYALRFFFETFAAVRNANENAFNAGRKLTGLE